MEANPDFTSVSTSELETFITRLCADLNAATYKQLTMIAEFDRRQGWGDEGVRSCAHWLNWRCGISLTAAREKVRVAHGLVSTDRAAISAAEPAPAPASAPAAGRVTQ